MYDIILWEAMIISLIILVSVIIEATLVPMPFALIILIIWSTNIKGKTFNMLILGVLGGGLLDILMIRMYGLTTAMFLITILVILRYSKKVETYRLQYLIPTAMLATGAYSYYFYSTWVYQVLVSVIIILFYSLINRTKPAEYDTLISSGF